MDQLLSQLVKVKHKDKARNNKVGRPPNTGYKKIYLELKQESFPDTDLPIRDTFNLTDGVMLLPLELHKQLQIYVYKINGIEYVDMRIYLLKADKLLPSKNGFRFPIEHLPQLLLRLDRLNRNIGRKKDEFILEI